MFQQYTFRMVGDVKCRRKKRIVKGAEAEVFWLVVFNIGHVSKAQTSPNATWQCLYSKTFSILLTFPYLKKKRKKKQLQACYNTTHFNIKVLFTSLTKLLQNHWSVSQLLHLKGHLCGFLNTHVDTEERFSYFIPVPYKAPKHSLFYYLTQGPVRMECQKKQE